MTEHGIARKLEDCMSFNTFISTRKMIKVFKSTEEFIDDNVGFDDLVFENFLTLFVVYYSFCVLILVVWLISQVAKCKFKFIKIRLPSRFV